MKFEQTTEKSTYIFNCFDKEMCDACDLGEVFYTSRSGLTRAAKLTLQPHQVAFGSYIPRIDCGDPNPAEYDHGASCWSLLAPHGDEADSRDGCVAIHPEPCNRGTFFVLAGTPGYCLRNIEDSAQIKEGWTTKEITILNDEAESKTIRFYIKVESEFRTPGMRLLLHAANACLREPILFRPTDYVRFGDSLYCPTQQRWIAMWNAGLRVWVPKKYGAEFFPDDESEEYKGSLLYGHHRDIAYIAENIAPGKIQVSVLLYDVLYDGPVDFLFRSKEFKRFEFFSDVESGLRKVISGGWYSSDLKDRLSEIGAEGSTVEDELKKGRWKVLSNEIPDKDLPKWEDPKPLEVIW